HLHAFDEETLRIDGEPDGVVDQCDGDDQQQCGKRQDYDADGPDVLVDHVNERFLVYDFLHHLIGGNLLDECLDAVRVGVFGFQVNIDGRKQRVVPEEFHEVLTQFFGKILGRQLFADVLRAQHVGVGFQLFLVGEHIALAYPLVHDDVEHDVFLHVVGQVFGVYQQETQQARHQQDQRDADY